MVIDNVASLAAWKRCLLVAIEMSMIHAHNRRTMKIKVIVHEAEEGGYWAEVPSIPGCAAQGESLEELLKNEGAIIFMEGLEATFACQCLSTGTTRLKTGLQKHLMNWQISQKMICSKHSPRDSRCSAFHHPFNFSKRRH